MAACHLELPNATDSELACIISLGLISVCLLGCFAFLVSLIQSFNSICLSEHGRPFSHCLVESGSRLSPEEPCHPQNVISTHPELTLALFSK